MTLSALGIFSAAGAGGLTGYELISTAFGNGSSNTISFTSIPQNYKHLQIRYTAKSTTASNAAISFQLNGVTTSSYSTHRLFGSGTSTTSSATTSSSVIALQNAMAYSTTTGLVAAGIIDIVDYNNASKNPVIRTLFGQIGNTSQRVISLSSGALNSVGAVTSCLFTTGDGNFSTISRFSLYGIAG
jgi:hypothetical protein